MKIHLLHHYALSLLLWTLGQRSLSIVHDQSYVAAGLLIRDAVRPKTLDTQQRPTTKQLFSIANCI